MRSKGLLLVLLCLLGTCLFYVLVGEPSGSSPAPSSDSLTQQSAQSLPPTPAHDRQVPFLIHPRLVTRAERRDEVHLLHALGFRPSARSYPADVWHNVSLPVFSSAVQPAQADLAAAFIRRFQDTFPARLLILYAVSLDDDDFEQVNRSCNVNSTVCVLRRFDLDRFPSHVSDLKLNAFRPLIIQEVLDQAGAVVWMDLNLQVWGTDSYSRFKEAVAAAAGPGIYSWTIEQPTSALTHPGMFPFFQTEKENFYFHRMIDPACLILFNTQRVHERLMLPWIRCALMSECISPIGAQSSGCRFDKKPLYRYSGCHFYDMSALNVILGLVFDFNEKPYAGDEADRFFAKYDSESISNDADVAGDYDSEKRNSSSGTKLSFNRSGWRISSQ